MNVRQHQALAADIRRIRPLAVVVLATLCILPSFWEVVTGNLSAVTLLGRLALALLVIGLLVWAVTGVILYYARVQATNERTNRRRAAAEREIER